MMDIYKHTILATVVFFLIFKLSEAAIVRVNSSRGDDSKCNFSNNYVKSIPCQTIEKAYRLIQNLSNVQMYIDSNVILQQVLDFESVQNVSILGSMYTGQYSLMKIRCTGIAGIYAKRVNVFTMSNLNFLHCGNPIALRKYSAGIILWESSMISLFNMTIELGDYAGLLLLNCIGHNSIQQVNFTSNMYKHASCVRRHASSSTKWSPKHTVTKKLFYHGNTSDVKYNGSKIGGGIIISLTDNFSNGYIVIDKCWFTHNIAKWGGGLYIIFDDIIKNNKILVNSTVFYKNEACKEGGGMRINIKNNSLEATTNKVLVENTWFIANKGRYAGGVGIISSYNIYQYPDKSNIIFKNCTWRSNTASVMSPAVDIASSARFNSEKFGFLPTPLFEDVDIINNYVTYPTRLKEFSNQNDGVFVVTHLKVFFSGSICFSNNLPTALKAVSGGFVFEEFSRTNFVNNSGLNGAAIALYGFSFIHLFDNISVTFKNNTAKNNGGAIFYNGIDQHDFFTGTYCFLERNNTYPINVTFIFDGNEAENGKWIYTDSVLGCASKCNSIRNLTFESIFKCIGDFKFLNGTRGVPGNNLVRTSGRKFNFHDKTTTYSVIPGGMVEVNYNVTDDFNVLLLPLTHVTIFNQQPYINFKRKYTLGNIFSPRGLPNKSAIVDVTVDGIRSMHFQFELQTLHCPPGFVYVNTTESCECGNNQNTGYYKAILKCNMKTFQAFMDKQYWAGYIPEGSENYSDLYFVPCYAPICPYHETYLSNSTTKLAETICGQARSGMMCGKCLQNYTVFYHSRSYRCHEVKYCHYGPLFYLLSELLPVLVVFIVVIMFDLTFTSGNMVGFIFFCQYLEGTSVHSESKLSYIKVPYQLFYGIFNLEYFSIEGLSFCLWKHFHIQEIILFKYVTISLAFILVIAQIVALKTNCFSRICQQNKSFRKRSFIHGLCAFLVICYIQCTKTSFLLLKHARPEGLDGKHSQLFTYYGGLPFFQGKHIKYTALAVFFLLTVTVFPLLILLLHPLALQLLSLCKLSEHWLVLVVLKVLGIQKLMPFLDCFQSCYKDKYRMFAGLYFAYRVALLLCFIMATSYKTVLVGMQFLLITFLGIHSVIQPYKRKLHNVFDSIIFANLAVINMLSIAVETATFTENPEKGLLDYIAEVIQIVLFYIPMIAFLLYMFWKIYHYFNLRKINEETPLLEDMEDRDITDDDYETLQCQLNSSVRDRSTYSL